MNQKELSQRELRRKVEEGLIKKVAYREVYQEKPNTFVLLRILMPGGELEETFGFAKVMYSDKWDAKRGVELAEEKAIAALAKRLVVERDDLLGLLRGEYE